ncbi:MAG: stage III sporulation protein AA [Clostridiales bacterium]|nr:stage III sporulation protein AA [Clostridiales bacterium]
MNCEEILSIFPNYIRGLLKEWNVDMECLREIRIRAGRQVLVLCGDREYVSRNTVTAEQVQETLAYLGNYSLYAYEDEIRQGFLSLPGGHRVGLAGKGVIENRSIRTMREISSMNIRFAHEVKGCSEELLPFLWTDSGLLHTLIASAPGHGKTTLLRDCIRRISDGDSRHRGMTVGVVDERSEIAGSFRGLPGNDVGMRTDVLDTCPKAEGMMMLIRSMAPEVIAVDEIGSREELIAMQYAMNCGCVVLATVHGGSMEELMVKPVLREMIEGKLFERYAFLQPGRTPGRLGQILDAEGQILWQREPVC